MVGYVFYLKNRKKKEDEWVQKLLKCRFFGSCLYHQEQRKNEVNFFCINCHKCLCQHCLSSSSQYCLHKLLQIRRYMYQDVVRVHDMHKHIDCSKVQSYTLNHSKVVYLNPRPHSKSSNGAAYCKVCERSLVDQNQYCSIACKVSENSKDHRKNFPVISIPELNTLCVDENQNDKSDCNDDYEEDDDSELLKPKKPLHKRKGIPHRAPFC